MPETDLPLKQRFVLDTSVFITNEIRRDDETIEEALHRFLDLLADAKLELGISCYMPPSIHEELTTMLQDRDVGDEVHSKINTWIIRKNPARFEVMVPADVVYEFVHEMSDRVNRGLRISERAVRDAQELEGEETIEAHEHMTRTDQVIADLRDKYRRTLRQGILDSREDFDLLILARELEAGVVTEDQGIINWAEDFGLRYMRGREFPDLLEEYLAAAERRRELDRSASDDESS